MSITLIFCSGNVIISLVNYSMGASVDPIKFIFQGFEALLFAGSITYITGQIVLRAT